MGAGFGAGVRAGAGAEAEAGGEAEGRRGWRRATPQLAIRTEDELRQGGLQLGRGVGEQPLRYVRVSVLYYGEGGVDLRRGGAMVSLVSTVSGLGVASVASIGGVVSIVGVVSTASAVGIVGKLVY